jgi:hypothetical protein
MDLSDVIPSPRKKLKMDHQIPTNPIDQSDPPLLDDLPDGLHDDKNLEQLNKEAGCGITELVTPGLVGFTGILKKR